MIKVENKEREQFSRRRDSRGAVVPKRILEILEDVGDPCRSAIEATHPAYKCRPDDWIFSKWHSRRHKIVFAMGVSYDIASPESRSWKLTICFEPNETYSVYLTDKTEQKPILIATKSGLWSKNLALGITILTRNELVRFYNRAFESESKS